MKIADCKIVGAMVAPRGKAAFDRANVVVVPRDRDDLYIQVRAYVGDEGDEIEGKPLTAEEWRALVRGEQAIELPPVGAGLGVALWVLRPGFAGPAAALEELRTSGVLLHDVDRLPDQSFACLVREPAANVYRDRWAKEAFEDALSWARSGGWERARDAASRAFVIERAMSPERIALLALAHERCGNPTRASGYVEMARRSRGDDFAAQVQERRASLEQSIDQRGASVPPVPRSAYARAMHRQNNQAMSQGLERLKRQAA